MDQLVESLRYPSEIRAIPGPSLTSLVCSCWGQEARGRRQEAGQLLLGRQPGRVRGQQPLASSQSLYIARPRQAAKINSQQFFKIQKPAQTFQLARLVPEAEICSLSGKVCVYCRVRVEGRLATRVPGGRGLAGRALAGRRPVLVSSLPTAATPSQHQDCL